MRINERILPYIEAAVQAGFTVHVPEIKYYKVGFVYVTREGDPGIAMIQVPTHTFENVLVDVPVKPSRVYGSSVTQDHDDSIEGVLALLDRLMVVGTVVPRFVGPHGPVPVDRSIGFNAKPLELSAL